MSTLIKRRLIGGAIALAVLLSTGWGWAGRPSPAEATVAAPAVPTAAELDRSVVKLRVGDEDIGSGVVIGDGTMILTAAHVAVHAVEGVMTAVTVDGRELEARVEWIGAHDDVALLRLVNSALPAVEMTCELPDTGTEVRAVGAPLYLDWVHTFGRVSDADGSGDWAGHIVFDAPVYMGNSGGPLFDSRGRLVGIVVAGMTAATGFWPAPISINFAVPTARICQLLGRV